MIPKYNKCTGFGSLKHSFWRLQILFSCVLGPAWCGWFTHGEDVVYIYLGCKGHSKWCFIIQIVRASVEVSMVKCSGGGKAHSPRTVLWRVVSWGWGCGCGLLRGVLTVTQRWLCTQVVQGFCSVWCWEARGRRAWDRGTGFLPGSENVLPNKITEFLSVPEM